MKQVNKRIFAALLACVLTMGLLPVGASAVQADHLIINQVYGGGDSNQDGTPITRSFLELYNPTAAEVPLNGWSITVDNGNNASIEFTLALRSDATLAAGHAYLLTGGEYTTDPATNYNLPAADQTDETLYIDNKKYTVTLKDDNGQTADQVVAGEDSGPSPSKQKSVRRIGYADTDTAADFALVAWEKYQEYVDDAWVDYTEADFLAAYAPRNMAGEYGTIPDRPAPNISQVTGMENGDSSLDMALIGRYDTQKFCADGGVMEIVVYNHKNGYAYAVNGKKGALVAIPLSGLRAGTSVANLTGAAVDVKSGVETDGFIYGDMTSVAVSPDGTFLAAAIQEEDYTKPGRVALFSCGSSGALTFLGAAATGVQPDMVTFTPDGTKLLTADEGEPRMGYSDPGAEDPKGSVTVIRVTNSALGAPRVIDFTPYDGGNRAGLISASVVLKKDTEPSVDLEPEYIACTDTTAYISLQENNAVAVLDLSQETPAFTGIYSVGFEDYGSVLVDLDNKDDLYNPKTYNGVKGIRMPDGISLITVGGTDYLLTANEGDARTWPADTEADSNELKMDKNAASPHGKIAANTIKGKVTYFDDSQYDGLETDTDYLFGGRSFTLLKVTGSGLEEAFDSGADFEAKTAACLPDYFNCSNDDKTFEDRSGKKGPEPETIVTGQVDGRTYAFIALERIGGVMVYDITVPEHAVYANYINSRDFSSDIAGDDSPEGLKFIPAGESSTGGALLLAACEVSGTMAAYNLTGATKIAVISDTHVYDKESLGTGAAFSEYLAGDRKMLAESSKLLDEAIARILNSDANYVVVSGDLTKDGEKLDHELVAQKLRALEDAGKQVFVINGNHDLSNQNALSYSGDTTQSVDTVNRDEFRSIYADYGYTEAIAKDTASLSYAVNLGSNYRLIVIDDCKYNNEVDSNRHQETGGAFTDSTMSWLLAQIKAAVQAGRRPIGVVHHGLASHTAVQPAFFPEYLTDDYETVATKLADAGLHLVFTGHFHSQDTAKFTSPSGSTIYDMETGSLVTYPSPIRYVTLKGSTVRYSSERIDNVTGLNDADRSDSSISLGGGFAAYSQAYLLKGLTDQVPGMLAYMLISQGASQADAVNQAAALASSQPFQPASDMTLGTFLATCMSLHYAGDEGENAAYASLAPLAAAMAGSSDTNTALLGSVAQELISDTSGSLTSPVADSTSDNTGVLTLGALPSYSTTPVYDDNDDSSSTPAGGNQTPAEGTVSGTTVTAAAAVITGADGRAAASVTQAQLSGALEKAKAAAAASGGAAHVEIKADAGSGVTAVDTTLPRAAVQELASGGVGSVTIQTPVASITFDQNALDTISGAASGDVTVSAARVEAAVLSDTARQAVGDRPVYDFSVTSGASTVSQFSGTVTVSVPYTPAAGEELNAIVIYYINENGEPEPVPGCRYDAQTGRVVFETDHFSRYAVGYHQVSFADVASGTWYHDAVSFLAAREVTTGTGGGNFSPDARLTRGQFITMLLKAYGIAAAPSSADNFADAGNTYYTGYLAAAKQLGVSQGVGDNRFAPEQEITRQEMFTLLYNALEVLGKLPEGSSGQTLSDFADAEDIDAWAENAMAALVLAGTVKGSGGKLSPTELTTRAQMAQLLYQLMAN